MDELERRLKEDAQAVEAEVSPQLRSRIDASIQLARESKNQMRPARSSNSLWWMSSLTGLTAALLVIAFINLTREEAVAPPALTPVAENPPEVQERLFNETFPLQTRPAVLTDPLSQELEALQSDLEKARESVEKDLKRAF